MKKEALILDPKDPSVIAARNAENQLYKYYGLQPEDHYMDIPGLGLKMRISEMGTGVPVIIVPGNTGEVFPLIPLLAEIKGRRIIAINRPGGGLSDGMDHSTVDIRRFAVQTILAVMTAFKLNKVDIIAHSMGAHWSLWTAMDSPGRVNSLTLLGNPGNVMMGKPPLILRMMMYWPLNKIFFKFILASGADKKPNTLKYTGSTQQTIGNLPKEIGECYYYFTRLPYWFISLTTLLQNTATQIDALQLSQVQQPAQLLLGDKDNFASVATGQSIVSALPDCKLHIIKQGSHLPWLEKPAECGQLINEFLNSQQATSGHS